MGAISTLRPGLLALFAITFALAAPRSAAATQVVFLDFLALGGGNINYTAAMKASVKTDMESKFSVFDVSFTLTAPTSGDFSTVTGNSGGAGGLADAIDFRNLDQTDNAVYNVNGWFTAAPTLPEFVTTSTNFAAHELGHILGLRHGDSFGPIGSGIHDPPGQGAYLPTSPVPENADETFNHLMASPASVGSGETEDMRDDLTFSERSAVKLAMADLQTAGSDITVAEQGGAHGTMGTAQILAILDIPTPNPLLAGDNANITFDVDGFNVTGAISANGQQDWYEFTGLLGELWNFEMMSGALDRIVDGPNPKDLDTKLEVYDTGGSLVAHYTGTATNDDEFETFDSILIDLLLPADGTYFLKAFATDFLVPAAALTGNYELFGYRFAAVPEPSTAALLALGLAGLALRVHRSQARTKQTAS